MEKTEKMRVSASVREKERTERQGEEKKERESEREWKRRRVKAELDYLSTS